MPESLLGSVLDRLDDPVLVVAGDRSVVWWNAAMARLAGPDRLGYRTEPALSCCEVLDCRRNTGGDEHDCLTSLVLEADEGLRRPVSLSLTGREKATLLTAVIAGEGADAVAYQLHSEASTPGGAETLDGVLRIAALGPLRVEVGGEAREGDWLKQRPGELLKYLICARSRPVSSETIAAALWPDRGPSAVANVRYFVHRLREHLERGNGAGADHRLIVRRAGGYMIDTDLLALDVETFEAQAVAGLAALEHSDPARAERKLSRALTLYRDDFLPDVPYVDWAFAEREYLRGLAGRALRACGQLALRAGRSDDAAAHFQRLAALEPFDTDIQQQLIEVFLRRGRRSEAMRHYSALRLRMLRAFGDEPDFDLADIATRLAGEGAAVR